MSRRKSVINRSFPGNNIMEDNFGEAIPREQGLRLFSIPENRRERLLNRLEKFKLRRSLRKKYLSAVFIFFFILTAGLMSADYGTNTLMTGHQGIEFISFENRQSYLEIILLNKKIYIDTRYINRDAERLKNELTRVFGS